MNTTILQFVAICWWSTYRTETCSCILYIATNWNIVVFMTVCIYRVIRNDCRGFNNCHLVLQMQTHVIYFYGVRSRIRFMFLLFLQVSRNWRYESEPPLKPSPLTCYRQFGTNSTIVLMFVESQRVHIQSTCKVCNKYLECCSIK